jgi:regulator of protease activity HflC (stomatin/prohibitin superfamily)
VHLKGLIVVYFLTFAAIFIFLLLLTFIEMILLVRQAQSIVIERFGKYLKVLGPGLHVMIPFVDRPRKVFWTYVQLGPNGRYYRFSHTLGRIDMREAVYDFPKQNVITKDNVTMEINALLYYQITDPRAAVYEVANLPEAIEKLTQTTLRNVIGSLDLDESLVSRDQINEKLRVILDVATDKWGVKVNRVELQEVNPPTDIKVAMEKQMRAERDRRAVILEAEGKKRAAILEAEGLQQAAVLCAEGEAQARVINADAEARARLTVAEAEAQALTKIQSSTKSGDPMSYMIAMHYIKVFAHVVEGKDNKLVIVPYESSSMMSSIASIKTLFNEVK